MTHRALSLENFGVALGNRVILGDVSFDLASTGMTVLVGPAGCGKSTLLRTLAGLNACHPSLVTWGTVTLDGAPLSINGTDPGGDCRRPALVMQHARFFLDTVRENLVSALPNRAELEQIDQLRLVTSRLEASGLGELAAHLGRNAVELPLSLQRRLAVARALMAAPRVLFVDEPTAGLDDEDAVELIAMLRERASERAILLVTHNQRFALAAGGTTLLLAGGRIQESEPTKDFFEHPTSEPARRFLRTGGCISASPEVPADDLKDCVESSMGIPGGREPQSRFVGPRGFFWVVPGRLGGMPRPGIIDELGHDLLGLKRLGVTVLVTLEESASVDIGALSRLEIRSVHFPIVDMGVPEFAAAANLCGQVDYWLRREDVVAMHCRAGLGRTGTLLACQLIWAGSSAREAIESIRSISPRCIQSDEQVAFLRSFATWLGDDAAARSQDTQTQQQSETNKGDTKWH